MNIGDNEILISLDVVSLFTNIPIDLIMKGIDKRWQWIKMATNISLDQFKHAIESVLNSTSFCFDGVYYEQIFGVPMGSPLSPVLADLVMEDLESECIKKLSFIVPTFF